MAHRSSSSLSIRWNAKIVLGGPAHLEHAARIQLAQVLLEGYSNNYQYDESNDGLAACEYLLFSGRAALLAEQIAASVKYTVRGRRIVIGLKAVDVMYRNAGEWRWWARIRENKGTRDPGEPA